MRTKILGIVVGVAVLHMVLFMALFGTSGCTNPTVMAGRTAMPPVPDNSNVIGAQSAPTAPMQPFADNTMAPAPIPVQPKPIESYPVLDLHGLPTGPVTGSSKAVASSGKSYTVVSGDTLGGIAQRHGVKTADLVAVNNLTMKSIIRSGQKLQIPAGGKAVKTATSGKKSTSGSKTTKNTASVSSGAVATAGGTYVVAKGDFPEKIAKKHKVSTSALLKANNLNEKSVLQIGQKLVIPGANGVTAPANTAKPSTPAVNTADLDDLVSDLPTAGNTNVPPTLPTVGNTVTPSVPVALPTPPTTGAGAGAANTVTPPATVPANVDLMPLMVDRDQPVKDFATRYGVTEEEIRKYNAAVIPADNILKARTIIQLPADN